VPELLVAPRYSISGSACVNLLPSGFVKPKRKPKPPKPSQTRIAMRFTPGASMAGLISEQSPAVPRQILRLSTLELLIHTWMASSLAVQRPTGRGAPVVFRT
jgi:hypothetical protein